MSKDFHQAIDNADTSLGNARHYFDALQEECEGWKKRCEELETENSDLGEQIDDLQNELKEARS